MAVDPASWHSHSSAQGGSEGRRSFALSRLFRRSQAPSAPPAETALAARLASDVAARLGRAVTLTDCQVTRTGALVARLAADRPYVAKMAAQGPTEARLKDNTGALADLQDAPWIAGCVRACLPTTVLTGQLDGRFYSVETCLPGEPGTVLLPFVPAVRVVTANALDFLAAFQSGSRSARVWTAEAWQAAVQPAVDRVGELARARGAGDRYLRLTATIRERVLEQPLPVVFAHGNFWIGNVLFGCDGRVSGVIDWDCAAREGLPLVDAVYLLVRTESLIDKSSVGQAVADWLRRRRAASGGLIERYCRALSIPPALVEPLTYLSWILHVDAHCKYGTAAVTRPQWLAKNIGPVLDAVAA